MNHKRNITIRRIATFGIVLALLATTQVFAHGGMKHVLGTVVKVDNNVLTVKTATGNVDVQLNDKTEITSNDQPAQLTDLKPGTRVVVHVMGEGKNQIAHTVKVGKAGGATGDAHKAHK